MNRTTLALVVAALCLGAWLAWSLQGSKLRPQIREAQKEARKARAESDALREGMDRALARADSLASVIDGWERDTVWIKVPSRYNEERNRYRTAGADSIRAVILWANRH